MLEVAISGATREWLVSRSEWGTANDAPELARFTRERLLAQPQRRYGRGYRTAVALPDAQARELARALRAESERSAERPSATSRALATDAERLRVRLAELPPKGTTGAGRGGHRHGVSRH